MRKQEFPLEVYTLDNEVYTYVGDNKVGKFELIWILLMRLSTLECDKKQHKVMKKIKTKLKSISVWKDKDHDARVCISASTIVWEDEEYELLKKHLENATPKVTIKLSELVTDLWDDLDNLPEYHFPPALVEG